MRMWMVNPKIMCRKHLLGEHVELHMLVGTMNKCKSIQGFIDNDLISPNMIDERHSKLVLEIHNRGYNHKSPLPPFNQDIYNYYSKEQLTHQINKKKSLKALLFRCPECKKRYKNI